MSKIKFLKIRWQFVLFPRNFNNEDFIANWKKLLLKGARKHEVNKVIKSKNESNESCLKFWKFVDYFFIFSWNRINEDSRAKNRFFWRENKNHQIKRWRKLKLSNVLKIRLRIFCWNPKIDQNTVVKTHFFSKYCCNSRE